MIAPLTFRPETDDDLEFLCALYASTREEEMAMVPWDDEQKKAFLRMQFEAQREHYRKYYAGGDFFIVEDEENRSVGRLYLYRFIDDLRIVDIAIVPEHRCRGFGGMILRKVVDEAFASGRDVTIHVERNNPALRLYERLGFEVAEDKGVYLFLKAARRAA